MNMANEGSKGLGLKLGVGLLLLLAAVVLTIACLIDAYHKINEGYVGIYYKHGALQVTFIFDNVGMVIFRNIPFLLSAL